MVTRNSSRCNSPARQGWVRWNWRKVTELPEPGETWMTRDTPFDKDLIRGLIEHDVIEIVEKTGIRGDYVNVYKTDERAYEMVQDHKENPTTLLPCCEGSWINNEKGVDGVRCGNCGTVHDRGGVAV